jgi:polyisoprenoid-binding protein YceI
MLRIWRTAGMIGLAGVLVACGNSGSGTATSPAAEASSAASIAPSVAPSEAPTATTEPSVAPSTTAEPSAAPSEAASSAAPSAAASEAASGAVRTFVIVPEESEATYDVQEQFLNQDLPVRAVGRTNAIEGEFQFSQDGQPTGEVTRMQVDLRSLTSDSARRDNAIRGRWLESDTYPFAEFVSTEVQNVPESYTEGEEISFQLVGDMTIRDVTQPVTWDVTGTLQGDTVTGTATTLIYMRDFGFEPPVIAGVLSVEDGVTLTVNFTAREQ